ncbi:hypothetical protein B7R54_14985 [Subtercola boreus]|uniref:Fibronectin type-III domain-containing protein n=1 Tax=Subtercola boreus TaxID=120213 RepID=A0A3E0VKF2_9MICO|nr:putative Ig domain-containing protein [Subtercola boreus]RFA10366.1 hypothetical protein B7R54_14985 [Subtercola boreus]TQL56121.1 putative repeat protein (TIGR01451 family) [Subtercola boreus]
MSRHARPRGRALAIIAAIALAVSTVVVVTPLSATAAGTVLFQNSFANRTVDGTGSVTVPTPTNGTNAICLTASGNSATLPLLSCPGTSDAQGAGKLRMTNATGNQIGGVFGETSFPTSNGLDVTFNTYQWGGGSADGMAFMLSAIDPANPAAPTAIGPGGGSLGYSPAGSVKGLPNAYLGVGLDVFGNFSSTGFQGTGCTNVPNITASVAGAVVVRGPGNNLAGYCGLTTTYTGSPSSRVALHTSTRAASAVPVQVLINPTSSAFASTTGVSVDAGTYKVVVTPVGGATKTLTGPLPTVAAGVYPSTSWLNSAGVPRQLGFAFVGSTGSVTDNHEASDVKVLTFNPVPQLSVAGTSFSAANPAVGAPVTYSVATGVQVGANETSPISMTMTTPAGVVPVGAFGSGWLCGSPNAQTVTCVTTASSFANGTALPTITVVAIVTSASMTAATVQNASTARVSSIDANPDTDSIMTAGTLPSAPSVTSVSPTIGAISGGGSLTVSGTSLTAATAIEIGTAAEQGAATPVVLLPCASGPAAGCFTVSGNTLVISSMPARASAAGVSVTVVTQGLASAATYVYASAPATPVAPTATAGTTSAVVNWVATATNGSALTTYTVVAYLGTTVASTVVVDAAQLTRTFTGLTVGGSYTFTVAATNAYGTSAASPKSTAVVPYTVPGAPVISAATAGDSSATLTYSAPSNGSSVITGYTVTPYLGNTAQAAQVFTGTATTQTVVGLTPGSAYTFTVAAQNAAGTGAASARSTAITPNQSPSLTFAAPPAGEVGVAYSRTLTVTNGTSPFTWSVSAGTLPPGLTLGATTGVLAGTPTTAGSYTFTVQIVDASAQTASRSVTVVIAAAPSIAFAPTPGEVGVALSQQPVLSGGTAPIVWRVAAGSLPAGVTLDAGTGLLSGTPTASGTFSPTLTATDAFGQVASKQVTLVIVALPTLTFAAPAAGQVGVAYSTSFDVTGGTLPLVWSIAAGSLPTGLTLNPNTGVVSGTPTTADTSTLTVSVVDANGQSATRGISMVMSAGPLVITVSTNVASAVPGSAVAYTITAANTSTTAFSSVSFSNPLAAVLDDATYNSNVSASSGTPSFASNTIAWTGALAAGATVTLTYSVTVRSPDTGNKILSSAVTSPTLGTNCATGGTDARCSSIVTVPGLTIVKTADAASVVPGATVRFTVTATNSGQTAYPAATFSDQLAGVLDDAAYNADGTATSGAVSYASQALTWTGALAVGASATLTYSVTVANPDTGDRALTGSVVSASAGSSCPAVGAAPQCSTSVAVTVPALALTTHASTATTTPGGAVTYTLTIANTGQTPYPATTTATLALAGALDDATAGTPSVVGGGTAAIDTSTGNLLWTGGLALGATVTVTVVLTVRTPDSGDKTMTTLTTSPAAGSVCPVGGSSPACVTTVQVKIPALSIATAADVAHTTPGSVVNYTLSVSNTGQTPYLGATVSDELAGLLDDAVSANDAAASTGSVSVSGTVLTWTGDLAVGATASITFSVTVSSPDTGDRTLTTLVRSTTTGANCVAGVTGPPCATSTVVLIPTLAFASSFDSTTTTPGSVVSYTVTVTNTGETAYSGAVVTVDPSAALDDATYNRDAAASAGALLVAADGTVAWTLSLATGASATATLTFTVGSAVAGDRSLSVRVASEAPGSLCLPASANASCVATTSVLLPALTLTTSSNTATVNPGGTVVYTVTAENTGETAYPAAAFSDSLAGVLTDSTFDFSSASATRGTLTYTDQVLAWTGALGIGQTATITYSVVVLDPDPGDKQLRHTVSSSTAGNNCFTGSTDARCSSAVSVLVPSLTVLATANTASTVPGASVGYTVTVTNSGPTVFPSARVTDSLAGLLDDASYNGGVTADIGVVIASPTELIWSGALDPGQVATITFSVVVNAADSGDDLLQNSVSSTSSGNNCAAAPDARCQVVVPVARLVLSQSYSQPTVTPGSLLTLTAVFVNTGQVAYNSITVDSLSADTVDDALPTGDQTATSGTLSLTATAIEWTGSIPIGGTVTVTGTLRVADPDTGNKTITGTVRSTAPGNTCPPGGTDARCTSLATVLLPGLTVSTTANATAALPGSTVAYTVTLQNTGQTAYPTAAATVPLAGVLDDADYAADASSTSGSVQYSGSTLSWAGPLAVGATVTIQYSVTVHAAGTGSGDKTMVTRVTSANVGSTCPAASGNAACGTTVLVLTPALTIVQTADAASTTLGTTVGYTVTVTNSGQTAYSGASFALDLAAVLDDATFTAGSLTATRGSATLSSGVITWSGGLTPTQAATIHYSVAVNNPSTGNRSMASSVVSPTVGSNCPSGSTDVRCSSTVPITDSVSLTFTSTATVSSTVVGATVQYTVTAANSSATSQPATFADALAGVLDDAVYNSDATATTGSVGFSASTLTWSGTLASGATATITYSVTVGALGAGDHVLSNRVSSTSMPASNNCIAASADPRCVTAVPIAALLIQQHYTETSTTPGSLIHLSATFTNTGGYAYTGITIVSPSASTVDDALPSGDQTASSGTLILSATSISWTGSIPVGGTVTVSGTLTVKNPDTGDRLISGTLSSTAPGSNCPAAGTDPRCTATLAVLLPGLTISQSANASVVMPGSTVTYSVSIHNSGQTTYSNATVADSLAGVLDDATYLGDAAASAGAVTFDSPTLTWVGSLVPDATATITYSVRVNDPDLGDKTMINQLASSDVGSSCLPATANAACRTSLVVLTPALTIVTSTDSSTSAPGETVVYTVTIANTGQVDAADAVLTASLAGVLDDAVYAGGITATAGTATIVATTLAWHGPLAIGAEATISYAVVVGAGTTGDSVLLQRVVSTDSGSTCQIGSIDTRCVTSVAIARLHIVNVADVDTTYPTGVVAYTGTFTNTGQVPYIGISVSTSFLDSADDATYNGDAGVDSGSLLLTPETGQIVWTGDIPVGGTVVLTGSVTVNNPDLGDLVIGSRMTSTAAGSSCLTSELPGCSNRVAVLLPILSISTTADSGTTSPGATVTYTTTATNTGPTVYTSARVTDNLVGALSDGVYNADASSTSGSVSFSGTRLSWVGDLALGQSVSITYSITVDDPDLGDRILANAVTSSELGSTCAPGTTNPLCATEVIVLVPELLLTVTADTETTVPGGVVGYTVAIANAGQTDYTAAGVVVDLSGALDDATGPDALTATRGDVQSSATGIQWNGDLAAGQSAIIHYSLTVADPDVGDRVLATSASTTAAGGDCSASGACANTVTVLIPGLAIAASTSTASTTPGGTVVVTIAVTNTGQTAYTSADFTSSLAEVVDDAQLSGPVSATSGTASVSDQTLDWAGALALGQIATISYTVVVDDPDTGDRTLASSVVSGSPGSTCPVGGDDPACAISVTVLIPQLTVVKTADTPSTQPGGVIGYTILVSNSGQTAYTAATVSDSLAGVLTDADYNLDVVVAGGGTLNYTAPTLAWAGDLAVGASARITYSVTVKDPDPGDKLVTNTVVSASPGSTCRPGATSAACSTVVRVLVPDLELRTTADSSTVVAGSSVHYTITVTNTGQTAYEPATVVAPLGGMLDDATYNADATATGGDVSLSSDGAALVWVGAVDLAGTITITFSMTADLPATGDHVLAGTLTSPSAGAYCAAPPGPGCSTTVAVLIPSLSISKTADQATAVAGSSVVFTLTATNTGEADYADADLHDSLAGVLDAAAYNNDASATTGSVGFSSGSVQWHGALARGAVVVVTYSVTALIEAPEDAVLVNAVTSDTVGSTCVDGSVDPACSVTVPVAARSISISGLTSSFTLTGLPNSTVTKDGAVTMTVDTNSNGGYLVAVQSESPVLTPLAVSNAETIPLANLGVRASSSSVFVPLAMTPFVVADITHASAPGGDGVSNDYRVDIPFVPSDTYSGTLTYIVSAQ